jgi:glycine cleavage system transcriptional repressor
MHVAVTAVGVDRPGIVAAVSRVLFEQGANIEDSRMAILGGHFAMVLIVSADDAAGLEDALQAPARSLDLVVSARPVDDAAAARTEGAPFIVNVYGADKPGIVAGVTGALADERINISNLATHVIEGDQPVYLMMLEVTLPSGADAAAIEARLKALGAQLGVDVSMHADEADTL